MKKTLLVIAGPTAVGKTDLCVRLAKKLQTDVVSADSRQLYRELNIGTAKPTPVEMDGVRHHFIDSHSIQEVVSAGRYERECLALLDRLFIQHDVVILTGGTGLYIDALCFGLDDIPPIDATIRDRLMARVAAEGLEPLQAELRELDPIYAAEADLQNTQRVVRALEVCLGTGQPFSSFRRQQAAPRPFEIVLCALDRPREELYARIDARMDAMLAAGLVDEARNLLPYRDHLALRTVGYQEVFGYFDGAYDYDEMVFLLKRNTRRYAKRQLTWFRHRANYQWFAPGDVDKIASLVSSGSRQ
ncbi:tRNA (adenosine(37)-N6)-dimethylallyltransferase MiaA [Rudanella paleaurantiibacter]|uniref:tRNA dimethylallyltransferase n=1 Tax=Rudanella paleaurantiibacter TaxID=2614655 RepID=A0A7J5TYZ1_9BACT|nr:tRNA (adenosine(37)-N6)-dimethylallyltransferase MiaA [Rudanella paleaurantiibacter]KAB7730362.1 tRNA (adenosine(37)-N6)-dimethylallyltransferase MiaA [Rudanella paleaurantiibacter]